MPGGQGERPDDGHLRADLRMLASLAKRKAWSESITDDVRELVLAKLIKGLELADSARDWAALSKAIATLERNDIERTKLLVDAHKQQQDGQQDAKALLDDLDEMRRRGGHGTP